MDTFEKMFQDLNAFNNIIKKDEERRKRNRHNEIIKMIIIGPLLVLLIFWLLSISWNYHQNKRNKYMENCSNAYQDQTARMICQDRYYNYQGRFQ